MTVTITQQSRFGVPAKRQQPNSWAHFLFFLLSFIIIVMGTPCQGFSPVSTATPTKRIPLTLLMLTNQPRDISDLNQDQTKHNYYPMKADPTRRQFVATAMAGLVGIASLASTPSLPAHAAADASSKEMLATLLARLRNVPTFCIVNTDGVPFMAIKQQDRMAKGYAFTSMEGAIIVLNDAQKAAKEGGYADTWKDATIVTLPADVAARLALQKKERATINRDKTATLDSTVDLIPTTENRDFALYIDKRAFQDQGKLPLFYCDSFVQEDGTLPMFLQKQMLVDAWMKSHPGQALPPLQAIDLTYMLEAALRGYTQKVPNNGNVVFIPDPEQVKIAKELRSNGLTMYKFDQMIV